MQRMFARSLSYCAVLTIFAVLFQSSPVFLPLVGMFFSPFATFPIALASYESKSLGVASYASAGLILLFIYPEEALIFFLTTGIIGIPLGAYTHSVIKSVAAAAGILFAGMNALTYLADIIIFGDTIPHASFLDSLLPYLLFSLGYSVAWLFIIKFLIKILFRLRVISKTNRDKPRTKSSPE